MSVGDVRSAALVGRAAARDDQQRHAPGDRVRMRVQRQLDDRRYLVSFHEGQHIVSSTVALNVGSTVRAVVTAVGEKLELRYVGEDSVAVVMADHAAAGEDAIAELAGRYAVDLQATQRAAIEQAMQNAAAEPAAMIAGGLFLSKLALGVDAANLHALYGAQRWSSKALERASLEDSVAAEAVASPVQLAEQMLAALQQHEPDTGDPERDRRELAQRLLNEQDDGSVAYRFGTLPVLVADQLIELDIVHFDERRREDRAAGMRRLVMTFSTSSLGRVEVVAQALAERLTIAITSDSPQGREVLAASSQDVRDLVARLGWNVESVSCDVRERVDRAARHVIDHVLNADTLSALV
jgi:hypothetical protein